MDQANPQLRPSFGEKTQNQCKSPQIRPSLIPRISAPLLAETRHRVARNSRKQRPSPVRAAASLVAAEANKVEEQRLSHSRAHKLAKVNQARERETDGRKLVPHKQRFRAHKRAIRCERKRCACEQRLHRNGIGPTVSTRSSLVRLDPAGARAKERLPLLHCDPSRAPASEPDSGPRDPGRRLASGPQGSGRPPASSPNVGRHHLVQSSVR